jgi:hypothetical protein
MASPEELAEDRRGAAHHEAGHAVAANTRGREVYEIWIHPMDGHTTFQETVGENFAFIVYGGPWAQARYLCTREMLDADGLPPADRAAEMVTLNRGDWIALEEATGGDVDTVKTYLDLREMALLREYDGVADEEPAPAASDRTAAAQPATPTLGPTWNREMGEAWPEVEVLAASLLAQERAISIGPGAPLILLGLVDGYEFWRKEGWTPTEDGTIQLNR